MSFQSLADGSVSIETLFRAKRLAEFDEWVKEQSQRMARQDKEVVEYFE